MIGIERRGAVLTVLALTLGRVEPRSLLNLGILRILPGKEASAKRVAAGLMSVQ